MSTTVLVIDLQYFGSFNYYKTLSCASYCCFEQYQKHVKRSFVNRCSIAGANGPVHLTIPIEEGRNTRQIMKDIRISKSYNWQKIHWRSLLSGYRASPWFEQHSDELAVLYSKGVEFLVDWNLGCFEWSHRALGLHLQYELTTEYIKDYPSELVADKRYVIVPGIETKPTGIVYQQVFNDRRPFIPGLSILDLLFCVGPSKALMLVKQSE